jgi:hypothetical protein
MWVPVDRQGLLNCLPARPAFGTDAFFDNGNWQWTFVPIEELSLSTIEKLIAEGFDEDGQGTFHLAHRIEILGRPVDELSAEILRVWEAGEQRGE